MTRGRIRVVLSAFLVALLGMVAVSGRDGAAQQAPGFNPGAARFTGKNTMLESASSETLRVARGRFEAGARSYWHSHDAGQLIFVQEGRGLVQRRGEPIKRLGLHDSDYTGPNVVHWHGAAPDEAAIFTTIGFGGATKWMEEVTEEQYRGAGR